MGKAQRKNLEKHLQSLVVDELKEICRGHELVVGGVKDELISRVLAAEMPFLAEPTEKMVQKLFDYRVEDLKSLCRGHGWLIGGDKEELVFRVATELTQVVSPR